MTSICVVTSFNEQIYAEYGHKMLAAFDKYWPKGVQMVATFQGRCDLIKSDRISYIDLEAGQPDLAIFKAKFNRFTEAHGNVMVPGADPGTARMSYNYRFDAIKFSHKPFSMFLVDANINTDILLWLDADAITQKEIDGDWLYRVMPSGGEYQTYLGRSQDTSEAGWLAYDRTHAAHGEYMNTLRRWWLEGDIFAMPEWHDSFVFDQIRHRFQSMGVMFRSLSGRGAMTDHPWAHSPLAEKIDHLKGPARKAAGTSLGTEFKNPTMGDITAKRSGRYVLLAHLIADLKPTRIIEVGTWNGERAMIMAGVAMSQNVGPVHYVGFDLFEDGSPATDSQELNVKPHFTEEAVRNRLSEFAAKYSGFSFGLHKGNSRETVEHYVKQTEREDYGGPTFVFIDGGHSVETIQSDFDNLRDLADLIVMDDFYEGGPDTTKFGCNQIFEELPVEHSVLLPEKDPMLGGGTVRLAVYAHKPALLEEIVAKYGCEEIDEDAPAA